MPANYLVETSLQRDHIQVTFQPHGAGHVVSGAARLELVQKPESLLRKRKRYVILLHATRNRALRRDLAQPLLFEQVFEQL